MIKVFVVSPAIYIFEVATEKYTVPPAWIATPVNQKCYYPVPGSIASYKKVLQ